MTLPEQSNSEVPEIRGDPWATVRGFRAVPCMDGKRRVSVEINCPDRIVTLGTGEALELAEHLIRVARTANAWKG